VAVNQRPSLRKTPGRSKPVQEAGGEQEEGPAEPKAKGKGKARAEGIAQHKGKGRAREEGQAKEEGRAKKSKLEALRRDTERFHLERVCLLFSAPQNGWTKKEALSLGELIFLIDGCDQSLTDFVPAVLFLFYGPSVFPPGFIQVRPTAPGL